MTAEFTPFRQIPEWADDEQFIITGKQLHAIQDMFKAYTPFITTLESLFTQSLDNGKITIRYEDLEGNPLAKEDIDAMLERYAHQMVSNLNKPVEG